MSRFARVRDGATAIVLDPRRRRIGYGVLALVLAVLCVFPAYHTARVKILPDDPTSNSIVSIVGALGGRAQNFATLFSGSTTDVALSLSRSQSIGDAVIRTLDLAGPGKRYAGLHDAQIALNRAVDIHSLTGGMVEIEVKSTDAEWALRLTNAYLAAINHRISTYGREQIVRKKTIVQQRLDTASANLSRAGAALNGFRQRYRLADPQAQLGSQLSLRTSQEAQLQGKLVELQSARQTAGPDNPVLKTLEAQIAALRTQIARAGQPTMGATGPSLGGLGNITLQYAELYRAYLFAQTIYEVYIRSMEEVSVQEVVAMNAGQLAIVDPPHVDPERRYNVAAVAALALLLMLAFFTEIYIPVTSRPGARRDGMDD